MNGWRLALLSVAVVAAMATRVFFASAPADAQTGGLAIVSGPTVAASETTDTMATVRWATSAASAGRVYFGETSALGLSWRKLEGIGPEESEVIESSHAIRLEELKPATTYFFKVWSQDEVGGTVESVQGSFVTKAVAVTPLRSLILISPAVGAKLEAPITLRARVDGRADTLVFTMFRPDGVPIRCTANLDADSGSEQNWSCAAGGLGGGDHSVKADATGKDESGATVTKSSVTVPFTVELACVEDAWECGAWGACSTTGRQTRTCTLKTDCPNVTTPKPAESQACEPPCTADIWSCGAWGICAKDASGKLVQSRSCTLKTDCPNVTTPKPETTQICLPTPGCTFDVWSCDEWTSCAEPGTRTKTRKCELEMDCPDATTPKPAESAECPPPCKEDEWSCGDWGKCDKTGSERRSCALTNDCPGVETPKPPEARPCMLPTGLEDVNAPMLDECERDLWRCGVWGECMNGERARQCALDLDCPNIVTPKPDEAEKCEPKQGDGADAVKAVMDRMSSELRSAVQDFEKNTENVSGGSGLAATAGQDVNEPATGTRGSGTDLTGLYIRAADHDTEQAITSALADECAAAGVNQDRCAAWLEARHADKDCAAAGLFSKDACEKHLTEKNDGTFPGCAGKTPQECEKAKALALLGYPTSDVKKSVDDILKKAVEENVAPPLRGLLATVDSLLDKLAIIPSAPAEGQESSPALVVLDTDKDGLPDDTEMRFGTNPLRPDVEAGGAPNARPLSRNILKTFFEKGDKPTQFVLIDTDGNGSLDMVEDQDLLELKAYDPTKVYLIGDTSVRAREVLKEFFEQGDKPTEGQFGNLIDSMIAVDLDGDGNADAHVSRELLKSRFQNGDIPDQQDLSEPIDSAFLTGAPLEQPLGDTGEVDPAFTVAIGPPSSAGEPSNEINDVNKRTAAGTPNVLRGHATPNTVVTLYVYSYVPMVLTTMTDENGEYSYDLSSNVVDGEHTVYVALTDDAGKITKKSNPLAFFVKEAQAVTEEDFLRADVNVPTEPVAQWQRTYLFGAAVAILAALLLAWKVMGKSMRDTPPEGPAAPPTTGS